MAAVENVTALDVAREFVATKVALREVISSAIGGQDFDITGLNEWAWRSPVPLSPLSLLDESDVIMERIDEIELEMLDAIGNHFLAQAARLRRNQARNAAAAAAAAGGGG